VIKGPAASRTIAHNKAEPPGLVSTLIEACASASMMP
jgi:hypothetical protein